MFNKYINIKKIIIFYFIFKCIEYYIFYTSIKKTIWNLLKIIFLTNKIIEIPYIIFTHIILLIIYINKKKNNKNIFLTIIKIHITILVSIITTLLIKKYMKILRPYNGLLYIIHKKNNFFKKKIYLSKIIKIIPIWLLKNWIKKKNYSFPSGHTIFSSYWIILLSKKNIKYNLILKYIKYLLILNIFSRIIFFLHRTEDIIFSILINIITIYIVNYTYKNILKYFFLKKN